MQALTLILIAAFVANINCFDTEYGQKLYSGDALESRYRRSPQNTPLGDIQRSLDLGLRNEERYRRSPQGINLGIPQDEALAKLGGKERRRRSIARVSTVPFRGNIGRRFRPPQGQSGKRIPGG